MLSDNKDTGNNCGHRRDAFRRPVCTIQENRPAILRDLVARANAKLQDPQQLPPEFFTLYMHSKGRKRRQPRSCLREAMAAVIEVMADYCHLSRLIIGIPSVAGPQLFGLDFFVEKIGWAPRRRVERALAALIDLGLFKADRRFERDETTGEYKGRFSVRQFTPALFHVFGLGNQIDQARRWAYGKLREKAEKARIDVSRLLKVSIGRITDAARPKESKNRAVSPGNGQAQAPPDTAKARWRTETTVRLMSEHPDWGFLEIKAELDRLAGE